MKLRTSSHSQAEQTDRFKEAAREIGCDEDEAAFKAKLAVIARQKPKEPAPKIKQTSKTRKKPSV